LQGDRHDVADLARLDDLNELIEELSAMFSLDTGCIEAAIGGEVRSGANEGALSGCVVDKKSSRKSNLLFCLRTRRELTLALHPRYLRASPMCHDRLRQIPVREVM